MALSWNEIKDRALKFSNEWKTASKENADKQTFYNEFFEVFGISRKRVASFEESVKKLGNKQGFIDLFWKGILLVEHKSRGESLEKAYGQALDYFPNLKEEELPKYILVSDFERFKLYDLEAGTEKVFNLSILHENVHLFDFIAGYKKKNYEDVGDASIEASELMGELYDKLKESGYPEHHLELFLVRLLFCLFADDTGIWEKDILTQFIEEKTNEDGSDIGEKLAHLFQVLNTPYEKRPNTLDEDLTRFAYINGTLFEQPICLHTWNIEMRETLLKCCYYNWSKVSPAIFGSLFQCVYDKEQRRSKGEHYTSEKNIMKLIEPLFLDDLKQEYEYLIKLKNNKSRLEEFHNKIASLKFLDPACGCGNFLVISYRELRRLEIQVLLKLNEIEVKRSKSEDYFLQKTFINITNLSKIDVDNFYGIEIEEFPAKIAEVALWMTDHLMNTELSEAFGAYFARIPLRKSAKIVNKNALRIDWNDVVSKSKLSYILGNPPFIGKHLMSENQNDDISIVFNNIKKSGELDYVTGWYKKACEYIENTLIKVAFVSTCSISQGEQVGILWNELLKKYGIVIHFAHRTFVWDNEARGKAHVHCVIIGFAHYDINAKRLYDYEDIKGEPHEIKVKNINPYLIDGKNILILEKKNPIVPNIPQIIFGSKPVDEGHFLFTEEEKIEFIKQEPYSEKFFKPLISSKEFLNNTNRWCLWLKDINPNELKTLPLVLDRVNKVRAFRLKSKKAQTRKDAQRATLFAEIRKPKSGFIAIPLHSSEKRKYIPFGFFDNTYIPNNSCSFVPDGTLYDFGILTSEMHMTWVKYTCGRIKSDYRYSNTIVYNNFPFPEHPDKNKIKKVGEKAQTVLDIREKYPDCSLAILYSPETMPPDLVKAHSELDRAADACYGKTSFKTERERIEFLFDLYDKYTSPLIYKDKAKKSKEKVLPEG